MAWIPTKWFHYREIIAIQRLHFPALKGLGVGFMLASQDMEIRGAGELLGDNQSGQITEIGVPALIPETYVHDVHTRLVLYKRIAGCKTERELDQLQIEFIDRFGSLPSALKVLFMVFELRLLAKTLGVVKLVADEQSITLTLAKTHQLDSEKLIGLIQQNPMQYQLKGADKVTIVKAIAEWEKRGVFVKDWLWDF